MSISNGMIDEENSRYEDRGERIRFGGQTVSVISMWVSALVFLFFHYSTLSAKYCSLGMKFYGRIESSRLNEKSLKR
jgi:hypothetical protein